MAMRRSRTVPAELWENPRWLALDPATRMTSIGLYGYADDRGRGPVLPLLIKAAIYPLQEQMTADVVEGHVVDLDDAGFLALYAIGSETYFAINRWPRVDHPNESDIPPPPADDSGSVPDPISVVGGESRGRAGEGERERVEGGEGAAWEGSSGPDPDEAPSPFCARHDPTGTEQPCRACGRARLAHNRWWQLQQRAPDPS